MEVAQIGALREDLLRRVLDHARLVELQRVEAQRVLGVEIAPAVIARIVQGLYGFTDAQMYGPSSSRNKPDERYPRGDGSYLTPRMALERFGTEAGRYCYKGTWCNAAIRDAMETQANYGCGVVFSDARFINEFDAIRQAGGKVIRVVRTGYNASTHESETEQAAIVTVDGHKLQAGLRVANHSGGRPAIAVSASCVLQ